MNKVHNAMTWAADSCTAGRELGKAFTDAFGGDPPNAIVVFASAKHDYAALLGALADEAGTETIVGASSAGEFTQSGRGEGIVSAMAIRSDEMQFALATGRDIAADPGRAAASMVGAFKGIAGSWARHRSALVMRRQKGCQVRRHRAVARFA